MSPNNQSLNNTQPAAGAEPHRRSLMDSSLFVFAISLFFAFITWLMVTMYFDPQDNRTITNATVNFGYQSSAYAALDLDIVEEPEVGNVRVDVAGNSTVIGNMHAEDIMVYPNYAAVTGPGEVTLRLEARIINNEFTNQGIELTVLSPTTVKVVFDSVTQRVMQISTDTAGVSIAKGFTLNRTACVPAEVTLRGPASELDRIASVSAPVFSDEELADNRTISSVLEMRDADGELVEPRYTTMDTETAEVTLTVYQVRELPLKVDFIGTPTGFDSDSLHYTLNRQTLRVAGPARLVGQLTELNVTSFDLSQEFAFGRDYQRQIELPASLVSPDGVGAVTLSFDTTGMEDTTLNISNIRPINVPSNYDVEILTHMINDVTLYGPAEEIESLSADSVLAQLDCQSLSLTAGQQVVPVTIQIPSSTRIFATGSYTVECSVTEK